MEEMVKVRKLKTRCRHPIAWERSSPTHHVQFQEGIAVTSGTRKVSYGASTMSSRKSNLKPQQTNIPQDKPAKGPPIDSIPFAKYTSIAGVHSSLLLFTALFLPQTSISAILDGQNFSQIGKRRDVGRILTEDPPRTLAWICLGAFILQAWWAGWVRGWLFDSKITVLGDNADGKLRRREWNDRKFAVSLDGTLIVTILPVSPTARLFGKHALPHLLHPEDSIS